MSLIDAFLTENAPLESPSSREFIRRAAAGGKPLARNIEAFKRKAVFVALRADGIRGTGTTDDPFNGVTARGELNPLPNISLASAFVPSTVTMDTETFPSGAVVAYVTVSTGAIAHELLSGDLVTVVGITLPPNSDVKWLDKYNGDKTIERLSETSFRFGFGVSSTDLPPGPVTSAVQCHPWYAIAETRRPHKFMAGDIVEISGVTGIYASYYNCLNLVRTAAGNTFTYRLDHTLFRGDLNKPGVPEGSAATCRKVVYQFDEVMRTLPPRSTVYLGEGTFETRGNRGGAELPDVPRHVDGQRIIGSGINATTLRVIVAEPPVSYLNYYAIGPFTY